MFTCSSPMYVHVRTKCLPCVQIPSIHYDNGLIRRSVHLLTTMHIANFGLASPVMDKCEECDC